MARIVGVDLPKNKRGEVSLTYIYGIGRSSAQKILEMAGVDRNIKVADWNDDQITAIRKAVNENYKVEGELRSSIQLNIKRLMDIGAYRGIRHRIGLPTRGQSTKNNARTRKGRRKTVAKQKESNQIRAKRLWPRRQDRTKKAKRLKLNLQDRHTFMPPLITSSFL